MAWIFDGERWMPATGGTPFVPGDAEEVAGTADAGEIDQAGNFIRGPHIGQSNYVVMQPDYKIWYEDYKALHPEIKTPLYNI
jgi:hypothetical protein